MPALFVKESFRNATENHLIGIGDVHETIHESTGDLFRDMRSEYGRCVGKLYRDGSDGQAQAIGWVFQGRDRYQGSDETYVREVWVEVHDRMPDVIVTEYPHVLN